MNPKLLSKKMFEYKKFMGQIHCLSKKKKSFVVELINRNNFSILLEVNRVKVIKKIHELHRIKLECKQGIEYCFIRNQKNIALALRGKYWYIYEVLLNFQIIVKKLDDITSNVGTRMVAIKEVIIKSEKLVSQSGELLNSNVERIMNEDIELMKDFYTEINKFLMIRTEIEQENEIFFQRPSLYSLPRITYRKLLRNNENIAKSWKYL